MKIIKYVSIFVIIAGLMLTQAGISPASAQGEPALKYKNVHLWVNPEYDQPGDVLVMMQGQLDGVAAPTTVEFLVPATAQMYSAGSIDSTGKYSGGPPNRQASSLPGWDEVSYTITSDTFRVEYYDGVSTTQPLRTVNYEFRPDFPITQLIVAIQQPKRSTNFSVTPAGQAATDSEGFNIQTYTFPTVGSESPLDFKITYTKNDNDASLSPAAKSPSNTTIIALIVIGGLVIIIVAILWLRSSSKGTRKPAKRQTTAPVPTKKPVQQIQKPAAPKPEGPACPECGEPTDAKKFCPNCGAKL